MDVDNLFHRLTPDLIRCIASCMHPNYVSTGFKLACREVAAALRERYHRTQLRGEPRRLKRFHSGAFSITIAAHPWPGAAFVAHWGRPEPWRALSRWQRRQLLCLAASSHHPPSLDAALAHCGTVIEADALVSAITAGDLAACRRLFETEGCDWDTKRVPEAAGHSGSLPVCEWLVDTVPGRELNLHNFLLPTACYAGHEHVVEWALPRTNDDRGWSCDWLAAAAAGGRVQLLQRLAARFPVEAHDRTYVLGAVAFGCPLAVLQQYYEPLGGLLLEEAVLDKQVLLLSAAASPTPDWADKCDWLWARWGGAVGEWDEEEFNFMEEMAGLMQRPDFPQRLQLLASRGLGDLIRNLAPEAAGVIGSIAAVEFCLDQLPALLERHTAAAAGGGLAAAGGDGGAQQPAEEQAVMQVIAMEAARRGNVPVLRLLRERGFEVGADTLLRMLHNGAWLLLMEEPGAMAQGGGAEHWSSVFRREAVIGADLPLLQHLHQQRGAAIDLAAVAEGGSEEALEWAVAALEAAEGQAPKPLPLSAFKSVLRSGNWAAADWLMRRGLVAAPRHRMLENLLRPSADTQIAELQWVMGSANGQEQAPQVRLKAELHAALVQLRTWYESHWDAPGRKQWLSGLIGSAAEALGGAAGGS